jgi:hypothetical protein
VLRFSTAAIDPVDSNTFNITAAAVATLTMQVQPSAAEVDATITPAVTVKAVDASGNVITGQSVAVSLVGAGELSGTTPKVTDTLGIATFDDLSIDMAGAGKKLRFTAGPIPITRDSALFNIYDILLELNDGWTLMSTDRWIDADSSAWEGTATLVYKYIGTGYEEADITEDLEPVEALYVKMPGGGWAGLSYLALPGASTKDLVAGWNLVSSATDDDAATVLSPLRWVQIGEQQGVGLTTIVAQGGYNVHGTSFYLAALTENHWDTLGSQPLDPFDGYWVYMTADTSFGVIPN